MLVKGTTVGLVGLLGYAVLLVAIVSRARAGRASPIRKMAPLDALPEAVGRAAEKDLPIIFSAGAAKITAGADAPQILSGMAVLRYLCKLASELKVTVLTTCRFAEMLPMLEATMKSGYLEGGRPELFNPDNNVLYLGAEGVAFHIGTMGLISREKPAATVFVGSFACEAVMIAEASASVGALNISGTARIASMPYLVSTADHALIGEEVYAAAAYLSNDTAQSATLATTDIAKIVTVAILILGIIMTAAGSTALTTLLTS